MVYLLIVLAIGFCEVILGIFFSGQPSLIEGLTLSFSLVSGLLTGLATALLVTRLASRLFGTPKLAIVFLMLYAVVQPLFPMVSSPNNVATLVAGKFALNIALYGKVTLVVVIHWLRSTHRISYYMIRARHLMNTEKNEKENFLRLFFPSDFNGGSGGDSEEAKN